VALRGCAARDCVALRCWLAQPRHATRGKQQWLRVVALEFTVDRQGMHNSLFNIYYKLILIYKNILRYNNIDY